MRDVLAINGNFLCVYDGQNWLPLQNSLRYPRDPEKILRRVNSARAVKFGTATRNTTESALKYFDGPKRTPKPENPANSTKEFSEQFEGIAQ